MESLANKGVQVPRSAISALLLCLVIGVSGCSAPKQQTEEPSPPEEKGAEVVEASESFEDRDPASADEYWLYADTSGEAFTPESGSPLRKELMDAARTYMDVRVQFVVHSLTVQGEIARGVIEPTPVGSDAAYATTWVLWQGAWCVVDAFVADSNGDPAWPTPTAQPSNSSVKPSTPSASTPAKGGMTAEELQRILEEQRAWEEEQARIAEEQRLAQARANWDAYNARYQQEYADRLARKKAILADRGVQPGSSQWEYNIAQIPREMREAGWYEPGPRP